MTLRLATPADAPGVAEIYAPVVRDTIISFETEMPTVEEMRARIEKTLPIFPWLVFDAGAGVEGYAYASKHRERSAYQWSVDVACYVHPRARRRGHGAALYHALLRILRAQRFQNAYAGIALPNEASVRLHESVGFQPIGVYRNVGYKLDAWRDVGWWECALGDLSPVPQPPLRLAELLASRPLGELMGSDPNSASPPFLP